MTHNVPGFVWKQRDTQGETKWEQRKRCDRQADEHDSRRLELDRMADEKRLNDSLKEVWE